MNKVEKMEQALDAALSFIGNLEIEPYSPLDEAASELRQRIVDALSEPPRNCDKFANLHDAWIAWQAYCAENFGKGTMKFHVWLYANEKGEDDGSR